MERLPDPSLVVLVGPAASGKSTWAAEHFRSEQIVSSDSLRAVVGRHERDQDASADAFRLLDEIVVARIRRALTAVVDTTGLNPEDRSRWIGMARDEGIPVYAVAFDTPADLCREWNRSRERPVPVRVLDGQLRRFRTVLEHLQDEDFDAVLSPGPVAVVPDDLVATPERLDRHREDPAGLRFDLNVASFAWPGGAEDTAERLAAVAGMAESARFRGLWVMDHMRQIPQVGPEWDPMLEAYATLAFLAGVTDRLRLGALVSPPTFRNPAHLGKIVATLDVLSGGRAVCGLGAGWFEAEHTAWGWEFPSTAERFDLLEDALRMLPLLWGPGSPSFKGAAISVPEALSYPRPIQERIPILVGGGGEHRTLRLVAEHADACNLFGTPEQVAAKLEILRRHCDDLGRDPDEVEVTVLRPLLLVVEAHREIPEVVAATRPRTFAEARWRREVIAGTVEDHIGLAREYADVGVDAVVAGFADLGTGPSLERFGSVIDAFP